MPRRYRNRRIGEFLKELKLTEGRSTGMPKIHKALAYNGSPPLCVETDEDRSYFLVEIPIHPEMLSAGVMKEATVNDTELKILQLCSEKFISRKEILTAFGHQSFSGNMKQALKHLKEMELIDRHRAV